MGRQIFIIAIVVILAVIANAFRLSPPKNQKFSSFTMATKERESLDALFKIAAQTKSPVRSSPVGDSKGMAMYSII